MSENRCVIVGGSHAGVSLAIQLRREGWSHDILLLNDEVELPYHRPPLSKDFLGSEKTLDEIRLRPAKVFEQSRIKLAFNTNVISIDTDRKTLVLGGNENLQYGKLALCVGSKLKRIPQGDQFKNVFYLRTAADAQKIKRSLHQKKRAVVIGAGYIGLEISAVLRQFGIEVTIIDLADRVLERVTSQYFSQYVQKLHEEHGVNFMMKTGVSHLEGDTEVKYVICENGEKLACDIVFIGIGVTPNVELAKKAGLKVGKGIIVDERCQTSEEDIYAAGDCTQHYNSFYDKTITLESVQNANDQGRCAATNIAGNHQNYESLPWFWSDQYDSKIQMVGLNNVADEVVVRGDFTASEKSGFALFYLKESRIVAADCVNRPKEFASAKQLIQGKVRLDASTIEDESIDPFKFKDYA